MPRTSFVLMLLVCELNIGVGAWKHGCTRAWLPWTELGGAVSSSSIPHLRPEVLKPYVLCRKSE